MFKHFIKYSATFALLYFFLFVSGVLASGKMEVPIGQQVILEAEDFVQGTEFKWVVTKDKEILATQTSNIFSYTFERQGEYKVNLSAVDDQNQPNNTTVMIMVGGRYSKPYSEGEDIFDVPLSASFTTLPAMNNERTVTLMGDKPRLAFDIAARTDILEHRIDRNIFVDTDGNGIPNDDIDNGTDSSFVRGGLWSTTYTPGESEQVTAEVTVVSASGKTAKAQVNIQFSTTQPGQGNLLAVLDTLPVTQATDNKIYLPGQAGKVAFYAKRSQGSVSEYRIDANILIDSNADGDPANDIDNLSDDSFKSGDIWVTEYQKTDQQIIAQFIAVDAAGLGSQIQREIVFGSTPGSSTSAPTTSGISLGADKAFVQKGDPIKFTVNGLLFALENYTFEWDFNGDGTYDQTTEGQNEVSYIYEAPGLQNVGVRVEDQDGNAATFNKEIQVNDLQGTAANFEYKFEGLKVSFTNLSTPAASNENENLTYKWSFGETDEKNYAAQKAQITLENPTYTYAKAGNYKVTLTVTDSEEVSSTKTLEVNLTGTATQGEVTGESSESPESGSLAWTIVKIILYILLGVVTLILLGLIGLLAYLKVKHPDLVFEELIDEMKLKILSMLGMQDDLDLEENGPPVAGVTGGVIPPYKPQPQGKQPEKVVPKPAPAPTPAAPKKESDPASQGPVPEWLKTPEEKPSAAIPKSKPEVIEAEVVENKPKNNPPTPPPVASNPPISTPPSTPPKPSNPPPVNGGEDLKKKDGPVPDWLKEE